MTDSVVVEGYARLRDGKKWKTRWLVLRKPSPVADCLLLLVYKDKSDKAQGNKERTSFTLEEICGLEAEQWYEGVAFTLSILCLNQSALLGFDSREALQAWDVRLRYSLGEVHRFSVGVLPGTKLESGPATLHLCNNLLALARDVPPVIIGHWNLTDLRRYGPVPNGFVFEGGTRCGYWAGVFLLVSAEGEQISFLFDCIVRGISPTRGPFGLRPVLPDPSASQMYSEEKLTHEAQELEKRLSMLSHRSSTVSSTYCPSAGGDDRSISGSSDTSDTSQSDCSIGSRLAIWSEPAPNPPESASHVAVKAPPRQLQEIGRQSSSDSGIATGSHSSYSGSFSSYTGSLDITSGEDFGSVFSLPPHLAHDLSPCICPTGSGHEYQVPTSLRYLYDSPRSLLQEANVGARDTETPVPVKDASGPIAESANKDKISEGQCETTERQTVSEHLQPPSEESKKTKVVHSSEHPDSCHICSSLTSTSKTIVTICSVCGGFKGTPYIPASGSLIPAIPSKPDTGSEYSFALKTFLEKSWAFPGSGSLHSSVKMNEELPLPKTGKEKLVSLLADLLGFPSTDGQPEEAKKHSLNWYVSMSPAFGNELKSSTTGTCTLDCQQDKRAAVYENCLKCLNEHCHPPPRVLPAEMYRNRNTSALQTFPAGLQKSRQHEAAVDVAPHQQLLQQLHQAPGDGRQSADRKCQNAEIDARTVATEDKRLNSKEERRKTDATYEVMESRAAERNSGAEERSKYELMGSSSQPRFHQEAEGAVFVFPPDVPLPEKLRSEGVTYVNIPISPTSKKQLNYMELELQEAGPGPRGTAAQLPAQRKSCTKYAQIDINATEMAHKVGTQHALGRQEGLHTLELRRKGTPQ
ncbi:hypothetical protein Q5P01_002683 [Channa striata]|uniref:Docking protein 7 n=1 Tax=Channa striata TaxID=64152 RepID=A0AA88TE70_CHASR|nr:hypothetical protein Q5P01_002683 [Channa striata]